MHRASWTRRGVTSCLDEPPPAQVLHEGRWHDGDLTATRREPARRWTPSRTLPLVTQWGGLERDDDVLSFGGDAPLARVPGC